MTASSPLAKQRRPRVTSQISDVTVAQSQPLTGNVTIDSPSRRKDGRLRAMVFLKQPFSMRSRRDVTRPGWTLVCLAKL